ncbi:hypothetical protein PLESTM_000112500 [Pleodorina starrii]|nr:hypothetical protein PLESTM_000112500 [Pleodorina starrii]
MSPTSADELSNGQDGACDMLALLPAPLLLSSVFPLLDAADLIRLGSCCRALRSAAFSDEVWQPRCEALGWSAFPRGTSWQAGFSSRRRTLCVECGSPSRYVFALLGCWLCEKCEHGSPRYGLVTALEAAKRYGVPYAALAALSYHEACGTRFYLRSAVEAIARSSSRGGGGGGGGAARGPGAVRRASDGSEMGEGDEEEEEEGDDSAASSEDGNGPDEDESSGGGGGGGGGGGRPGAADRRADDKAARKAAKKAAKEAQRLKRQGRNTPGGGGGGGGGGGRRQHHQQQQHSTAGGREGGAQPHGRRRGGDDDDGGGGRGGAALPLEGQAVALPHNRRRAAGGGSGSGGGRGGGVRGAAGKLKSGWAAEREALMAAWGQFGISGLVLATG